MTETTAMDEYRRLGLAVVPATKDPVNGVRAVKAQLKARDKHGMPVLVFNAALRRTLFEISRGFVWDGEANKPIKENDDMMECLYRLCLQGLPYVEPAAEDAWEPIVLPDYPDNVIQLDYFDSGEKDSVARKARFLQRYRK